MKSKPLTSAGFQKAEPLPHTIFITVTTKSTSNTTETLSKWSADVYHTNLKTGLRKINTAVERFHNDNVDGFYWLLQMFPNSRVVSMDWERDAILLRVGSEWARQEHGCRLIPTVGILPPKGAATTPFKVVLQWPEIEDRKSFQAHLLSFDNFLTHETLGDLGKTFGIMRLPPTDPGHAERDLEILSEGWFMLHKTTQQIARVDPGITIGQASMKCFLRGSTRNKLRYWDQNRRRGTVVGSLEHEGITRIEEQAYRGGRSEVFWHGAVPREWKIHQYDINSLYPFFMTYPLPVRYLGEQREPDLNVGGSRWLTLALIDVPPEGPGWLGFGPYWDKEHELHHPCGPRWTWLWDPMLKVAQKYGWVKNYWRSLEYEAIPICSTFVNDLFKRKAEASGSERLMYKLLLNSLYGKFAQREYGEWQLQERFSPSTYREETGQDRYFDGQQHRWLLHNQHWSWIEEMDRETRTTAKAVPAIAGWITSAGRAYMWEWMAWIHSKGEKLLYTDTDSIFTTATLPTGEGLGEWRHEQTITHGRCRFFAPKHYQANGVAKIKGVPHAVVDVKTYDVRQRRAWGTRMLSGDEAINGVEDGVLDFNIISCYHAGVNHKRALPSKHGPTNPFIITECPQLPT